MGTSSGSQLTGHGALDGEVTSLKLSFPGYVVKEMPLLALSVKQVETMKTAKRTKPEANTSLLRLSGSFIHSLGKPEAFGHRKWSHRTHFSLSRVR